MSTIITRQTISQRAATMLVLAGMLSMLVGQVHAHGFLYSPNGRNEPGEGSTRSYGNIMYSIDTLRSPTGNGPMCRGQDPSLNAVPVTFGPSGSTHTVTLAYSIGAQHNGPCTIEIINPTTGQSITVGSVNGPQGCARPPTISGGDTDKLSSASNQCGHGRIPRNLRTDDMCLFYWTFRLQNVERISCTRCIMRWFWSSTHTSPPELYENCIDVNVNVLSGGYGRQANQLSGVEVNLTDIDAAVVQTSTNTQHPEAALPNFNLVDLAKKMFGLARREVKEVPVPPILPSFGRE
ncbi:hypothetical protein HDU67_006362 [Dinochytrium kinnereticum]|nr:hypothetical protein HDU67_006362 [Dinochytrium kinnereticum]